MEDFRDQFDRRAAQLRLVDAGGGALGELSPDQTIVIQRPLKVTADEAPGKQPHPL